MVIDAWELYEELMNKDKCSNCGRKIIDDIKTEKGCVWCDTEYHRRKNAKK